MTPLIAYLLGALIPLAAAVGAVFATDAVISHYDNKRSQP